jgi:hypothetical protein
MSQPLKSTSHTLVSISISQLLKSTSETLVSICICVNISSVGLIKSSTINKHSVNIYPNPTSGIFTIKSSIKENSNYEVTDAIGKIIFSGTIKNFEQKLDLGNVENGIYTIKIISDGQSQFIKLVKQF